jgi:hypothetical protein
MVTPYAFCLRPAAFRLGFPSFIDPPSRFFFLTSSFSVHPSSFPRAV